jgi:NADPH-dependent ferric siderophore reductase
MTTDTTVAATAEAVDDVAPSVLLAEATVRRVERLSPAFVRVALGSPAFTDLGVDGFDTRFKIVFPNAAGALPEIPERAEQWYERWMATPDESRSPMRTYTVRDVVEEGGERLLVVDLVVHEDGPHGPACRWALAAAPGDVVQVIAPHRASAAYGGTEFGPGEDGDLLLVADETAVPALARILADVGPGRRGRAFVEVPAAEDVLPLDIACDVELTWLVRDGAPHGRRLVEAVRRHLGLPPLDPTLLPVEELPSDLDIDVWETPRHSSSGEDLDAIAAPGAAAPASSDLYAWIAGESWLVKALRRSLVTELGVERGQVAFMGYWREGIAMRS